MSKNRIFNLLFVISILFFSCEPSSPKKMKNSQILDLNLYIDPPTLDPRKGGDVISSTLHFMLFEGLTRISETPTPEMAIAEKVEISADKKIYTFHLRKTKWSDGSPVTAFDFERSWKDMLTPSFPCPNAHLLYPIKNAESVKQGNLPIEDLGIYAPNESTFIVELEKPTPYFLQLISFCVFFPVHQEIAKKYPKWADTANPYFVSNGPFMLSKWKKSDELIVVKNPLYWEKDQVQLEQIRMSIVEDKMTALQLYEKGEIAFLGSPLSDIPFDSIPTLKSDGLIKTSPVSGTTICPFNIHRFPFQNENMRKAFTFAINRKEIIDNITQLDEKVATGALPPILKGGKETEFFPDANYDLAKEYFEKALAEMGISRNAIGDIELIYPHSEVNKKVVEALQQQWFSAFNIQIKIKDLDFRVFLDHMTKRNFQLAQFIWIAQYNDAMNILERFKYKENPKNYSGWENQEYISVLEEYLNTIDDGKRLELMERAEKIFISEMPIATIFHWNYAYLQKDYLKGFYISPIGSLHFRKAYISMHVEEPQPSLILSRE